MNNKILKVVALCIFTLSILSLKAQPKVYYSEVGVLGGTSFYMGEFNKEFLKNPQPSYGFIFRHKLNPRIAVHANFNYSNIFTDSIYVDNLNLEFPVDPFKYQMISMDASAEFNFFNYEDKPFRPFSKKYTAFIFAGLGGGTGIYKLQNDTTNSFKTFYSIPFGVGFKVMLGERFNFNAMWTSRLMTPFDNINFFARTPIAGNSVFNKDLYTTISLGLTYNIFRNECDCLNSNR